MRVPPARANVKNHHLLVLHPRRFRKPWKKSPNSGVMKLLLDRYLNANNGKTWKHLCTYEWEGGGGGGVGGGDDDGSSGVQQHQHHDGDNVEAIDLEFPHTFPKFSSGYHTPPDFTHYIDGFVCTLDYILMTNNFVVERTGATPTRDDVKEKYIAMPNECMPSDHVSLVCDLRWR
jgi:hypothetical protein